MAATSTGAADVPPLEPASAVAEAEGGPDAGGVEGVGLPATDCGRVMSEAGALEGGRSAEAAIGPLPAGGGEASP